MIHPRYKKFLEALPRNNNNVLRSALEAGYSETYARKNGKAIMRNALRASANAIIEDTEGKEITKTEGKRMMLEIMGYTPQDVVNRLRMVADQEKDLSSKLKVLAPLAKELGVILNPDDEQKTIVPTLNIGVVMEEPKAPHDNTEIREIDGEMTEDIERG